MARSKETFNKRDQQQKKLKQRQDKLQRKEERKANSQKGKGLDEMMAYVDENGNLSDTSPDPRNKKKFVLEDIQISIPKMEHDPSMDLPRKGVVTFFNDAKGFGFINDQLTNERIFVHINSLTEEVRESDKVEFEIEKGPRGLSAVNVKKLA